MTELTEAPPGLWRTPASQLHRLLSGPTLLRLRGARRPALFVSVLLHGNETSGWDGLRELMQVVAELPRDLVVFIGNVHAAAAGVRHLPQQPDFNRIWRNAPGAEGQMAKSLLALVHSTPMFAAVDLHNNTGRNPHYAVLTRLCAGNCGLASLLADRAVLVEEPDTVLTRALEGHCPVIAAELGPVGDPECVERARRLLDACLQLDELPASGSDELVVHRALARVHVAPDVSFTFAGVGSGSAAAGLVLTGGLEAVNFHPLPPGTEFGRSRRTDALQVRDPEGVDVTSQFLRRDGERLLLARSIVPAMYTTDEEVVRQDCLCYLMEPLES